MPTWNFVKKAGGGVPAGAIHISIGNDSFLIDDGANSTISTTSPFVAGELSGHPWLQQSGGSGTVPAAPVIEQVILVDGVLSKPAANGTYSSVVNGNPFNSDARFYSLLPPYNVKADSRTVTDAAITSGQATLSSTAAAFTSADVGKVVVVIGAGAAGAHLYTTISSVSGGVATLAANAGTTVSGAECSYATDNTAAIVQCMADAGAIGGTVVLPSTPFGVNGALPSSLPLTIEGSGVKELYGGLGTTNDVNFPTIAPYLTGSVIVQYAANTDVIQGSVQGRSQHFRKFGARFAGRFRSTGHGLNCTPSTGMGNIGGVYEDVRVFGHDGNHYGFLHVAPMLQRHVGLRAYGGGGQRLYDGTASGPPGNITSSDCCFDTIIGGSAHAFVIDGSGAQNFDACVFTNLESQVAAPSPAIAGTTAPTSAQACYQVVNGAGMVDVSFISPGGQTNVSSTATFPDGPGCYRTVDPVGIVVANASLTTSPASGGAVQNLTGKPQGTYVEFMLQPAASATASTTTTGAVGSGSVSIPVVSSASFSVGQGIQIDTGVNMEFAIVDSKPDGTHINVTGPGNFGLELSHLSGVTVAAGAAVVYAEVSNVNAWPNKRVMRYGLAIGENPKHVSGNFSFPTNWWYRLTWANCSRWWVDYLPPFG